MNKEEIKIYRSPDGRCRTDYYESGGSLRFALAEKTMKGTLITEFSQHGMVLDQVYSPVKEVERSLKKKFTLEFSMEEIKEYERVRINAECWKCHKENITRELDFVDSRLVDNVPVVPTFRCVSCGQRFYGMSEQYLEALVKRNAELFEKDELEEKAKDERSFVNTLNEYVIRIFASKKISRLVVKE